jgi:hypothetical protein
MLSGKKTYILVAGAVLVALGQYLQGQMDVSHLIEALLSSGAVAALRSAVAKGPKQ